MNIEKNYIAINQSSWNRRTESHVSSEFYDVAGFLKGNTSLNSIELKLLGDITGKSILHLQCHFGQDTIALQRMGAIVTGIDLSDQSIKYAHELSLKANIHPTFICSDVYDLPNHLNEKFDIVYTSYGTIGWLPDLDRWAQVISHFLKPNGQFIFVEFHPVVWMFDDDFTKIKYHYFNTGAIIETESGTYANRDADFTQEYICWNHPTSEVLNALIGAGLTLNSFDEFDYSPYNCFNETMEFEPKKYRIKHLGSKIPMVYAIVAGKK